MLLNLRKRWTDIAFFVLISALVFATFHFSVIDRQSGLRLIYPLQASLAKWKLRCSEQSPLWLTDLMKYVVDEQFSLSNQLVYLSPDGRLHHCESGWQGAMLRSSAVTEQTRFRIASITKLVTADAVLAQIGSGELSLDTRLLDIVDIQEPVADQRLSQITIGQLLRHRAGFDRLKSVDPMTRHAVKPWCPGELRQLARLRLDFSPDERSAYSNLGYCLLGVVLEKISRKPFREFVEERYGLSQRGLQFVDGPYLGDEVVYDFRNSAFYGERYYRYFDFPALSSSAGLSGSAASLAPLIREMVARQPTNLTSAELKDDCDTAHPFDCFGYAVSPFSGRDGSLVLHVQAGLLFGSASTAVIDSEGGVTVWLGSGMSQHPHESAVAFVERVWEVLAAEYRKPDLRGSAYE